MIIISINGGINKIAVVNEFVEAAHTDRASISGSISGTTPSYVDLVYLKRILCGAGSNHR